MTAMSSGNLSQLIEGARTGTDEAIHSLLEELEPFLFQCARQLIWSCRLSPALRHQSHSDLVQEVRLRIWKGIANFRGATDEDGMDSCLRRWIVVVMQRAFSDMVEGNRLPEAAPLVHRLVPSNPNSASVASPGVGEIPSTDPSPSRNFRMDERATRVRDAIERLADVEDRFIIEQYFFHGQSLRSIAAELGVEYTKLRRRFNRVLTALGSELEDV